MLREREVLPRSPFTSTAFEIGGKTVVGLERGSGSMKIITSIGSHDGVLCLQGVCGVVASLGISADGAG